MIIMKVTEDDADGDIIAEDAVAQQKRHSQLQSTQNTTRYYKIFCRTGQAFYPMFKFCSISLYPSSI